MCRAGRVSSESLLHEFVLFLLYKMDELLWYERGLGSGESTEPPNRPDASLVVELIRRLEEGEAAEEEALRVLGLPAELVSLSARLEEGAARGDARRGRVLFLEAGGLLLATIPLSRENRSSAEGYGLKDPQITSAFLEHLPPWYQGDDLGYLQRGLDVVAEEAMGRLCS